MDASLFTGYAQVLTRRSERDDVYRLDFSAVDLRHVAELLDLWEPRRRHAQRIRFDLARPHRLDPVDDPGEREPAGAIEQGAEFQSCHFEFLSLSPGLIDQHRHSLP